jgi:hypothetical protein
VVGLAWVELTCDRIHNAAVDREHAAPAERNVIGSIDLHDVVKIPG